MIFKTFQLIIGDNVAQNRDIENIIKNGLKHVKDYGNDVYEVTKEIIDDRFLWMACEYDNASAYNENVLNCENDEKEKNPRNRLQIELRKQLFVCYDVKESILYINGYEKKGFVQHYINSTLNKEVKVKNIYSTLEEFQSKIKSIRSLKFVQKNDLINGKKGTVFSQQLNILGLDFPEKMILKLDYPDIPINQIKNSIKKIKKRKDRGEYESILLIGADDSGVEQSFDFSSIIKNIELKSITKKDNGMYDSQDVKYEFLKLIKE